MNTNLIHKWLRDPRFAPVTRDHDDEVVFLPVEVSELIADDAPPVAAMPPPDEILLANCVDITLSDGRRLAVEGPTALSAVVRLVRGLMA